MLSNFMVGFLAAVGFAGWVYAKMQRQSGGNTSNSLVVAGGAGLVLFLIVVTFLGIVF